MFTLTDIAINGSEELFIAAVIDDFSDESPDHCMIFRWAKGEYRQRLLDHSVARIVVSGSPGGWVYFLGTSGISTYAGTDGIRLEVVDSSDDGPSSLVIFRDAEFIDGKIVACGMARMVYERDVNAEWHRMDEGVFLPRASRDRAVGFHALSHDGSGGILFVGQYGEIWRCFNGNWSKFDSPTNVALTDIAVHPDGRYIACGMGGTLLVCKNNDWLNISSDFDRDFWSVCEFNGDFYLASSDSVFRVGWGGELSPVLVGVSSGRLVAGFGILWSLGSKGVYSTADGVAWDKLLFPFEL